MIRRLAVSLLFLAPLPARAVGVCELLYDNFLEMRVRKAQGESAGALYAKIFAPEEDALHPSAVIRREAFGYLSAPGADTRILARWQSMKHRDLAFVFEGLSKLPEAERARLTSDLGAWDHWAAGLSFPRDNLVRVDKLLLGENFYKHLLAAQAELKAKGVATHIEAGAIPWRKNQAVLVVDRSEPVAREHDPSVDRDIFSAPEFAGYLAEAEKTNGKIIVDIGMEENTLAFFDKHEGWVPGKDWVVALAPDTPSGLFVHEWQHKTDFIDNHEAYAARLLAGRVPNDRQSAAGLALRKTGELLEQLFATELNAATAQYRFYAENHLLNGENVFSVLIYRASNERKLAIGRIFIDPTDPKHYVLYLKSRLVAYSPVIALGALAGGVAGAIQLIDAYYEDAPTGENP